MEYEKIKQLMEDMGTYKLDSIDLELSDGTKIHMKKLVEESDLSKTDRILPRDEILQKKLLEKAIIKKIDADKDLSKIDSIEERDIENQKIIKSPMVGTFYSKPSPTSDPYVENGKNVKKGDVVCIIEAMKLMNEIESEFEGKIVEVFVNDGDMVEYGSPLFAIE